MVIWMDVLHLAFCHNMYNVCILYYIKYYKKLPFCALFQYLCPREWCLNENLMSAIFFVSSLGNLWRELWETATPLPAIRQTPLFDEDLAV